MAKAPTTKTARAQSATASTAETAPPPLAAICMLVPQEGPTVSRLRGDVLTIGIDVDADEAQRLVDADFAEPA